MPQDYSPEVEFCWFLGNYLTPMDNSEKVPGSSWWSCHKQPYDRSPDLTPLTVPMNLISSPSLSQAQTLSFSQAWAEPSSEIQPNPKAEPILHNSLLFKPEPSLAQIFQIPSSLIQIKLGFLVCCQAEPSQLSSNCFAQARLSSSQPCQDIFFSL